MPRKKILYIPNVSYHVVSRCIELKPYLNNNEIKHLIEKVIIRTQKKYTFKFYGYVIMNNHIHLYIGTVINGEPIYRIVQYFKARVAEDFNRRFQRSGHFWNERYKCKITEDTDNPFQYCINLHHYICYNPVKAGLTKHEKEYLFSSHQAYVTPEFKGTIRNIRIDLHPFLLSLNSSSHERVKKYIELETLYHARITSRHIRC